MDKRVNVGLRYDVYSRLKERGRFGETFSDVVSRIMNESVLPTIKKEDGGKDIK
jgi:predicted CopG family antitoxin